MGHCYRCCVWLVVLLPNAAIFSPDVVLIEFHNNDTCAAHGTGYKTFIYAFGYTTVYGLLGFTVSLAGVVATVWFIRRNTRTSDITLVKVLMKFAVFLVLGNVINFVGQIAPFLFAAFAPAGQEWYDLEKAFNYVEGVFILLSLLPTPALILIYLRSVRHRTKCMLCGASIYQEGRSVREEQNWQDSYWQCRECSFSQCRHVCVNIQSESMGGLGSE